MLFQGFPTRVVSWGCLEKREAMIILYQYFVTAQACNGASVPIQSKWDRECNAYNIHLCLCLLYVKNKLVWPPYKPYSNTQMLILSSPYI